MKLTEHALTAGNKKPILSAYYFFFFVSFGGLYPLLPLYLQEQGLSGREIGMIVAIGPLMTVLFQPIWGMICDRYQAQRRVLIGTLLAAAILSLIYPFGTSFPIFLLLFAGMTLFNSSGVPIIDSISLGYVAKHGGHYGSLRLWGALGFAAASFVAGRLADWTGLVVIFYIFAGSLLTCVLLARSLPHESGQISVDLRSGLRTLLRVPKFMMFLLATFLIFGTIQANNSFYGIFFTAIGGGVAGVGLSFLIAAGSEAPFMLVAGRVVERFGYIPVLVVAGLISSGRWLFYGTEPSSALVLTLLFLQGISVGLYLPAAAQFVREISPPQVQVTALAIYGAIGNGLGSMAGAMIGGIILDRVGIFATYTMFGVLSMLGVAVLIAIRFLPDVKHVASGNR